MTTIGFIGSGLIGGTVARLAAAAGDNVVLSNSRGPETLADLVADIGPLASAATAAEAAAKGDIVLVSIPLKAYRDVPVEQLAGKIVMDTNNYYSQRDGQFPEIDSKSVTSSGLLQQHLPTSRVVKVFNNIFYKHLGSLPRPAGAPDRTALSIFGDDADAKATVTSFLASIGYDTVDGGALAESWRQEPGSAAYGGVYGAMDDPAGTPASAAAVRAAIGESAQR